MSSVNRPEMATGDNVFVNFSVVACYSSLMNPPGQQNGLNTAQNEAVLHTDGPLLIIAGAGAGKTRTIAHRIAHLIEKGVHPSRILAVTFTNKAAHEMRDRVNLLVPKTGEMPMVTTFHALGVRILREFHAEAGIPKGFTIWDRDDSVKAVKRALEALDMGDVTPRQVLSAISSAKSDCISGSEYAADAKDFRAQRIARVWDLYEKALREESALDFDDLIDRTLRLFETSPETLSKLQARWSHVHIDEYQDTNKVQYEIARLLAGERMNLCVVGDLDQAIYTWRNARLENLLEFEHAFPNTKIVTLEQNYRSTRTILTAANGVIEKNLRRKPKRLFTEKGIGEAIVVYGAQNEADEAWFIAQNVQKLLEQGTKASEIAILYRENFQSRAIEEAFLHLALPYRVLGTRFFERKEVKDTLSYLRAGRNESARGDLVRIAAVPPRGIGKVTLEKMLKGETVTGASALKINTFRQTLAEIKHALEVLPASEAIRFTLERSGMETFLKKDLEEGPERLENVRELVNLATRYDDMMPPEGIDKILEEAALQSDQDELQKPMDAVSLMTIHAAKGLEFDIVFITGLEQGLFPSIRADDSTRDPEEERRLFYVALTRARERLFLSYARDRMRYGERNQTMPSEFFDDIDARLMIAPRKEAPESEGIIY